MPAIASTTSGGHKGLAERTDLALLRLHEDTDVEFKRSAPWEALRYTVSRTALAMANLPNGGIIVFGVSEEENAWKVTGLTPEHLSTFAPDTVLDQINAFASPAIGLTLVRHSVSGVELL